MRRSLIWQRWLLALSAVSLVTLIASQVLMVTLGATIGIAVARTDPAFVDHVIVRRDSPAARAGVETGDTVDRRGLSPGNRTRFATDVWNAGVRITLRVERHGELRSVTIVPEWRRESWTHWLGIAGELWLLGFATVLAIRRADSAEARILALLLIVFVLSLDLSPGEWISTWPPLDATANMFSVLATMSIALLATYAFLFARPPSMTRRVATWTTYVTTLLSTAFYVVGIAGSWNDTIDPYGPAYTGLVGLLASTLSVLFPLVCAFLGIAAARGADRTRIVWAVIPLAGIYVGLIVSNITAYFNPAMFGLAPGGGSIVGILFALALFIAPLGLTYSLLSHRLLDIGFALNRAAIFAATSLLLAGLFSGLQLLVNGMLSGLSRAHNLLVQAMIAIVVYYAVRLSRARTDAIVTKILFGARQRRISAIRELARAVDEVREAAQIGAVVTATLRSRATVDATVYLEGENGDFFAADASLPGTPHMRKDDVTIVYLRSLREPAHVMDASAPDALAVPMLIRGRLRGVMICQPPQNDDDFAPDEVDALFFLASKMASARDDLLSMSLREELHALRAQQTSTRELTIG
jgi:hypothetical protein